MSFYQYEDDKNRKYLSLGSSEAVVFAGATRLLAAHITRGEVTADNEDEMLERCLQLAIRMADRADDLIRAEGEL